EFGDLPRFPVPVDAIPDIGENQQIVFTEWPGRSPQDVEDQVTYPLTVNLLGIPGVKTIRSLSMFGFSSIYIIFDESVEFYWSRSRVLEKLSSLPPDILPADTQPALGPDATALGQIFWYTLEGRDANGNPAGGWDLDELRSIQDWHVRYALLAAEGVAEVASVGGFQREYQIDVDPDAMLAWGVTLPDIADAVRRSNLDAGARTIEINQVEYIIRGLGFIKTLEDIENIVVRAEAGTPALLRNIAHVALGPAERRGALDKAGAEAVGGVVTARYGDNPLAIIKNVKEKIAEIAPGLPRKMLEDGTVSQVTIVSFYDRTGLIRETLTTLYDALSNQILVAIIVIIVMMRHIRSSLLISSLLPLAVLTCFIMMRLFGVDANIVALSGIAIAIGTVVDMGIVLSENIINRLNEAPADADRSAIVRNAAAEVGGAITTAVATTIVSFLPVFTMTGAEGKLFSPLAFTKTFALFASIALTLTLLPPLAQLLFRTFQAGRRRLYLALALPAFLGTLLAPAFLGGIGWLIPLLGGYWLAVVVLPKRAATMLGYAVSYALAAALAVALAFLWEPLGAHGSPMRNVIFVFALMASLLLFFQVFHLAYAPLLRVFLRHKAAFLLVPSAISLAGFVVWLGYGTVAQWLPERWQQTELSRRLDEAFPGLGREFMPPLDEGAFLYMPVTMPHASIGEVMDIMRAKDMAIQAIPEVESVVGKLGRAESPLDPAPVSMIETVINYKPEYLSDEQGRRIRFRYDAATDAYARDERGDLIPDPSGRPYRQWRARIRTPDDIWDEIVAAAQFEGLTSAPKLQPISARIVMLQSGMRAPMGVKIQGPDLKTIEQVGYRVEELLKQVEGVEPAAVVADRVVGKPYLEIRIDRERIARYGVRIQDAQDIIATAIGGMPITRTVEGRERYNVRARYLRELRDSPEALGRILVPARDARVGETAQIPLEQLADIVYAPGPQMIKSEDTFLVGYVLFDKAGDEAEVDVVERAQAYLREHLDPDLPAGVSYTFAGMYENQLRARRTLMLVLPLSLFIIFLILYQQFRSIIHTLVIFTGIFTAWSGGFILLWLYGQPWFLDGAPFGVDLRELFQIAPVNLSVAVWVGFLALFGIATDDGVVMLTYLGQSFKRKKPDSVQAIRDTALEAGARRVRPCLMTSATTILALIPVLTSTGRGADVMIPMAIPSIGGMAILLITLFATPVLYAAIEETKLRTRTAASGQ
ncbi:MAG TPA: efflux RND transporter permease subunit, partial [Candidatus Hydrogenedentes bacterium]|nr:efflux RND transporter permease subunit [Candidatus Hydrogenedentota bacterium]